MGNSVMGDASRSAAPITRFYSHSAWVEGRAEDQLTQVAAMAGITRVAVFPDLHPGKYGPVGCAILAERIFPYLIGNDIGCGMALFALDLPAHKLRADKAADRLRRLEGAWDGDAAGLLAETGLPRGLFAGALGSIGGGNHFCEVQTVETSSDPKIARDSTYLLVHSGSRGLGTAVLAALEAHATSDPAAGLAPDCSAAQHYVAAHDQAVVWAKLNRHVIAQRAAEALRADLHLIADAPHNLLQRYDDQWLHRKGAAVRGELTPLAGTRATLSYLLAPGDADTMGSVSHGAGRKYDRSAMHGRVGGSRSALQQLERTALGGRVICEDKALLIEEAPEAYKSAERVVQELETCGVGRVVAAFRPVITFKKAREQA